MKNSIKALLAISAPLIVVAVIFNITVLKAFADSKKLESAKIARLAMENVKRAPAIANNQ